MQAIKFFKPLAALALCTLALSAAAPSLAQEASLKIDDPWVRATVPSQHATGVFMRLTSATPARLVAVESQAAKHAEVHEMAMQDNVMKMRRSAVSTCPPDRPSNSSLAGITSCCSTCPARSRKATTSP